MAFWDVQNRNLIWLISKKPLIINEVNISANNNITIAIVIHIVLFSKDVLNISLKIIMFIKYVVKEYIIVYWIWYTSTESTINIRKPTIILIFILVSVWGKTFLSI